MTEGWKWLIREENEKRSGRKISSEGLAMAALLSERSRTGQKASVSDRLMKHSALPPPEGGTFSNKKVLMFN